VSEAGTGEDAARTVVDHEPTGHRAPPGVIAMRDLGLRYPGRREPAIEGVSLEVASGERLGVAGRTGAGKSSLALAAAGFVPRVVRARVSGEISIDGVDATTSDASALLGRVGIVFSTPANQLSASKPTVREELAFGLENLGVPRDEMQDRIDGVLDRLHIGHLAEREPFALSGGEQQRVAIASIVAMGTRVLVLDEPTAQLDPVGTLEVGRLLAELAAAGTTVLCVEHDASILGTLDRVAILDHGRVVGIDRPGHALGRSVAGSVGLPAPTMVQLAEVAGIDPAMAWHEDAVVEGLGRAAREGAPVLLAASVDAPTGPTTAGWTPRRERGGADIEIESLVHRYDGGQEAVRDVSLAMPAGQAVAILGQNGSGKTTLVKHLNGLLRPTSGAVRVGGLPTSETRVDRLAATVGFVFQNPDDQLFERSVEREIAFGPRNLGFPTSEIEDLVAHALDAVGLSAERATNPYDLDLSQRKLVALASVLATDPAVIILDEPTAGQDPDGVTRVGGVIADLKAAGRTVVAITHDMEFAATGFDRVIVMRQGVVMADGDPATVLAAGQRAALASTGLTPPPAVRIAAALGLADGSVVDAPSLLRALSARG
jgi:energy-coupling factor transporter ATP-binding protein EcfA2